MKPPVTSAEWHGDVLSSATNDNDKRFHDWGQSESGMAQIVDRFTFPSQIILDPFMGGGTTGLVSVRLGRQFIGSDADAEQIAIATSRLAGEHAPVIEQELQDIGIIRSLATAVPS